MSDSKTISACADTIANEVIARLARGELVCLECENGCGVADYSSRICQICSGPLVPRSVSGDGHIHSFAVYHVQHGHKFSLPHTVVFVELEEGCRLAAVLANPDASDPTIGGKVEYCGASNGVVRFSLKK